jgi:hypothetical protein
MTGYEKRLYSGWEKTAADLLKDNQMVASTVKQCLGVEMEETLESGEKKNVPFVVQLVGKLLAYWYDHPEKIDLKVLSNVLGETKQEIAVDTKTAAEMFRGVTAGSKVDGSSS